jgi:hypothetical protein
MQPFPVSLSLNTSPVIKIAWEIAGKKKSGIRNRKHGETMRRIMIHPPADVREVGYHCRGIRGALNIVIETLYPYLAS